MIYEINEIVRKIGEIGIDGNVVPNEWYFHLKNDNGKIQANAVLILAEIVNWYQPIPIYDIENRSIKGYGKKFKDDLLQIDYKYFNEKFGFTEEQSRSAIIFLEKKNLVFRVIRKSSTERIFHNNVMFIGIDSDKILEITGSKKSIKDKFYSACFTDESKQVKQKIAKSQEKDWSAKFTSQQKEFLSYLLEIAPEIGDLIEKNHATWWIKSFGIEKIKVALEVYWQQVEKAKRDSSVPMPKNIGKYVRKALNENILPESKAYERLEKNEPVIGKNQVGHQKNTTTNISMTSLFVNEVNDKTNSLTFQKEKFESKKPEDISSNHTSTKSKEKKLEADEIRSEKFITDFKPKQNFDWSFSFTSEDKKFISYLLRIKPEKGSPIEEKHATWWIKKFGIEKIRIALQVYWQQVEKAKNNKKVPMPESIGGYVRDALNKGTQPCRELDKRNRAFAEKFKRQVEWSDLTITEKYCRAEQIGKEWYFNLPESIFSDSLKNSYENFYSSTEKQNFAA